MSYIYKALAFVRVYKWYVLALVAVLAVAIYFVIGDKAETEIVEGDRTVEVVAVAEYARGARGVAVPTANGNSYVIRSEASGKVLRAGNTGPVASGALIAQLENSAQRAALTQAEGALDAAKAAVGGTRGSALTTVLGAYASIDNAINDAVGQIHTDPENSQSSFSVSTRDTQALALMEELRPKMQPIIRREESQALTLTAASDFTTELATLEEELRLVRTYLDTVLKVLNAGVVRADISSATIGGYVADVSAARTAVTASLTAVISARTSLDPQGAVSASDASIKQAQGAYNAALASYEKTVVRAPFAGTLTSVSAKPGDIISTGSDVAIIIPVEGAETVRTFVLPLSSVKYTPAGALVFTVNADGILESRTVETGLVTADSITVTGLNGDETIVKDVRGLKAGEKVAVTSI